MVQNIRGEMLPHKIQPKEHSMGSGLGGILYNLGSVWVNDNGNRNYPYLNSNDDKRKLNLNWNDDDNHWNETCRFLALRKSFYSLSATPGFGLDEREEFYFLYKFIQPPIMVPILAIGVINSAYFLLSKAFISHKSFKKNFNKSNLMLSFWIMGNLVSLAE